ncbi:MAG: fumarate hydratase [Sphaerochaetaceae bacterium]|nr:fumarate hydratase [Sphaerochaetaceae bacterium]
MMGEYDPAQLARQIADALIDASRHLESSLITRMKHMADVTERELLSLTTGDARRNRYEASLEVLRMIMENLGTADHREIPMCQDTGMVVAFVAAGPGIQVDMARLSKTIDQGISMAAREGCFRNSVVADPVFERHNTGTNLPPVIHWLPTDEPGLTIRFMLKGFGSENCTALAMLNPTAGSDGVVATVADMVRKAGGKPCPPIVVGVGIGGTAERALLLSKIALLRPTGEAHPDPRYAALEQEIERAVQALGIGPGGFGGPLTALGVAVEHEQTHIAGLPVAVSISCWADRKAAVVLGGCDET